MPWYAWAYLLLLALVGRRDFLRRRRANGRPAAMLARLAAMVVVMLGVALFYRGEGAGMVYMILLFLAALVLARMSAADALHMRENDAPADDRLMTALGSLALLPAIAMGAIAVWVRQLA